MNFKEIADTSFKEIGTIRGLQNPLPLSFK